MAKSKIILNGLFIALFVQSCQFFTQTETHYIKIDVYVTKPICADNFPSDLKLLATPFEIENCENFGFIPKMTIHRMDLNSKDTLLIEPSMSRGKVFHQKSPFGQEKQEINLYLAEFTCNDILSKASDKQVSFNDQPFKKNEVFLKYDPLSENNSEIYSKMDSLISRIKSEVFSNNKVNEKHFVVYYGFTGHSNESKENDNINMIIASADSAMSAGNYDNAVRLYEQAATLDPSNQKVKDRIIIIKQTFYPPIPAQSQSPTTKSPVEVSKPSKPTKPIKPKIPVKYVPFYGLSIEEKLTKVADEKNSIEDRRTFKDITLEDFVDLESVVYIVASDTNKLTSKKSISSYLNYLYQTRNYKIVVIDKTIGNNGKISSIHLSETFR